MRSCLYILIIFSGLVLLVLSNRARKHGRIQTMACHEGKKQDVFENAAWYLYQMFCVRFLSGNRKGSFIENILQLVKNKFLFLRLLSKANPNLPSASSPNPLLIYTGIKKH